MHVRVISFLMSIVSLPELNDIAKRYPNVVALDGVDLSFLIAQAHPAE